MFRWKRTALVALATLRVTLLSADTLILQDGRTFKGEVSQNDSGNYVVKTKAGQVTFSSLDVAKWEKGNASETPPSVKPPIVAHSGAPGVKVDPAAVTARATKLIDQGYAALQAADAQAALENLLDAKSLWDRHQIRMDPSNPPQYACLNGLGIAYLALGRYEKANEPLDRAYASSLRERSLIINRAILDLVQKTNVTRGLKELKDYLSKQPASDEVALNVMGAGLGISGMEERFSQATYYQSVVSLYESKNNQLEATHSGEGRWGAEWISLDQVKKKKAAEKDGFTKYQEAIEAERAAQTLVRNKQANADAILATHAPAAQVNAELEAAHQKLKASELRHHEAWKAIPRPEWPKTVPPVLPQSYGGLAYGTPISAQIAVAIAAPQIVPPSTPKHNTVDKIITAMPPLVTTNTSPTPQSPTERSTQRIVSRSAVAVPVGPDLLVTAAAPIDGATVFQLENVSGDTFKGELVRRDAETGLALIRVTGKRLTYLNLATGFAGGDVTCWGFPEVSIFNPIADSIGGSTTAPKAAGWTVMLRRHPRLMGAAILDGKGALIGITIGDREIPASRMSAVTLEQLRAFLGADAPQTACSSPNPSGVMQLTASREVQ